MTDSNSPNEHIEHFLSYYLKLQNSPYYAVLLKGPWGVGKTWLIKQVLKNLDNPDHNIKRYLYVSLYGVTNFKEIEDEFFNQMYPLLSSKGVAIASKLTKSALSLARIKAPEIELSEYLNKTEGLILVFDDLERASIDLISLLGYINYFVEQQGNKVIILANENEILDDINDKNTNYKRIKEKLIGKTFEVKAEFDLAIKNFIEEVEPQNLRPYFEKNLDLIKEYYDFSGYENLRHLRQAIMDFARLIENIPIDIIDNQEIISHMLSIFLLLSFEIRSGRIIPKDINEFQSLHYRAFENEKVKDNFYKEFQVKYPGFTYQKMLFEASVWIDIFDKGLTPIDKMQELIYNSKYFNKDERANWVKLWDYIELNDDEFDSTINSVRSDFQNRKYEKAGIIKHITGLFLLFSDINLINQDKNCILKESKRYIDDLVQKDILLYDTEDDRFSDGTFWAGLGFHKIESKEFKELQNYIDYKKEQQKLSKYPSLANELLEYMKTDISMFYQIVVKPYEDRRYINIPILKYIRPQDFIGTFLKIHPKNWPIIIEAIKKRYNSISNANLLQELVWLERIVILLDLEVAQRAGKLSGYQLSSFIKFTLIPSIDNLKTSIIKHGTLKMSEPKNFNIRATAYSAVSIKYKL